MSAAISMDSLAARNLRARLERQLSADDLDLPLLPDSAAQVLAACNNDDCDARALAELIQRDPALTSHTLRVANSTAYAPEEPIVSLQQAVSRLGIGTLCGIAVSVVAQGQVFDLPGHTDRLTRLWRHSAITGAWSKEVARARRRNVEGAFLAGLLHDLGKPIVLEALSGLERLGGLQIAPDLVEQWLDDLHPEVGARLLATWGLPSWVQEAAAHHHDPDAAPQHADEARTVLLADLLAHADEDDLEAVRKHEVLQGLGLYVDELDELLTRREHVLQVAEVFL